MREFPHMNSSTFPDVSTVDVYKYNNEMNYARFNNDQMRITLCSVPWDLGEAHVGQRTIEGVGNVVDFGGEDARNAYFDSLDGALRFDTKFRRFHMNDSIKLPVPVTTLATYNYVEVMYYPEPGTGGDLEYSEPGAVERWYYFIREIRRDASNTSVCSIMADTWQTFIYRIDIPYMYLTRGHWAVAHSDVDEYLSNPAANSEYLLTPDDSFGEIGRAKATVAAVLNDDVYACIATTGDVSASANWGSVNGNGWNTPACYTANVDGGVGAACIAMERGQLVTFLNAVETQAPQFLQTVLGVFFAPKKLVSLGAAVTLFGVGVHLMNPQRASVPIIDLAKSQFGYADEYADLAKLYTFPYAALDVYSDDGSATRVNIEDTSGTLTLSAALQLTWPWISIDAQVQGLGGAGAAGSVTFYNGARHVMPYSGMWYQKLMRWGIPVYGVVQSAGTANFSTYWSRQQQLTAAANQQTSETASANLQVTNAEVQTTANANINSRSNQAALMDTVLGNSLNQALQAWNAGYTRSSTAAEIEGQQLQAAVGAAAGVVGSVASGALSGGTIGAIGGLISGAISGGASMANTAIAANMESTKAEAQISNTQAQVTETNTNNSDKVDNQTSANTDTTTINNNASAAVAANSTAVGVANAARNYSTASSAVSNQVAQARLGAPMQYGSPSGGETGSTRPIGVFATVVTQSDAAIAQAGDEFLRFGYRLNRYVKFDGFNVMPHFSFWQCQDMQLYSSYVPDAYMDQIRMLLFGGVTVWRDPSEIGAVSIYENK